MSTSVNGQVAAILVTINRIKPLLELGQELGKCDRIEDGGGGLIMNAILITLL